MSEQHTPCKKCESHLWHLNAQAREIELKDGEIRELNAKKFARFHSDECWIYQGDDEDHLESLVCPVVIAPTTLLELIKQRDELLAALEAEKKDAERTVTELLAELLRVKQICLREVGVGIVDEVVIANVKGGAYKERIASVKGGNTRSALQSCTCHRSVIQETSTPAIVFYPSGSLGEPVESEGGES